VNRGRALLASTTASTGSRPGLRSPTALGRALQPRRVHHHQQLAKNLWLGEERTLWRKLARGHPGPEARGLGKTVLELYLNRGRMGDGVYGADAASWYWSRNRRRICSRRKRGLASAARRATTAWERSAGEAQRDRRFLRLQSAPILEPVPRRASGAVHAVAPFGTFRYSSRTRLFPNASSLRARMARAASATASAPRRARGFRQLPRDGGRAAAEVPGSSAGGERNPGLLPSMPSCSKKRASRCSPPP